MSTDMSYRHKIDEDDGEGTKQKVIYNPKNFLN